MKTITIHRTYEKSAAMNRDVTLYRSDGEPLRGEKPLAEWVKKLKKGTVIRTTYVNCADEILSEIAQRGVTLKYANWHDTKIAKGLDPQEIVDGFAALDDAVFRTFHVRPDIAELRGLIDIRRALIEERKKAVQRIRAVARGMGMAKTCDYTPSMKKHLELAERMEIVVNEEDDEKKVSWIALADKDVSEAAKKIKECVLFNKIAHISDGSWVSAANVVSLTGGIERFPNVASLWAYCGEHVVNGRAPKRAVGAASNWNARLRTCLWQMGDSIIKQAGGVSKKTGKARKMNPWRAFYDEVRAEELAAHDVKCKQKNDGPCAHPDGHCGARAQRKMRKEILKRFFLACQSIPFEKGHVSQKPEERFDVAAD